MKVITRRGSPFRTQDRRSMAASYIAAALGVCVALTAATLTSREAEAQRLTRSFQKGDLSGIFNDAAKGPPPSPSVRLNLNPPNPSRNGPDIGGFRAPGGLAPSNVTPNLETLPPRISRAPATLPGAGRPPSGSLRGEFNRVSPSLRTEFSKISPPQ